MLGAGVVLDHRGTVIKHNRPKDKLSSNLSLVLCASLDNYDYTLKSKYCFFIQGPLRALSYGNC